jgi:membrane protein implicated in regulation of membrane protease activity
MQWLTDHPVLMWVGLALILAVIEVASLDFFFVMLALAALFAALLAALGVIFPLQVAGAGVAALVMVLVLRPPLVRRLSPGLAQLTGTAALVGRSAIVLAAVDPSGGQIKLAGEVWSARKKSGTDDTQIFEPGQTVWVQAIEGATAMVVAQPPKLGSQYE